MLVISSVSAIVSDLADASGDLSERGLSCGETGKHGLIEGGTRLIPCIRVI